VVLVWRYRGSIRVDNERMIVKRMEKVEGKKNMKRVGLREERW